MLAKRPNAAVKGEAQEARGTLATVGVGNDTVAGFGSARASRMLSSGGSGAVQMVKMGVQYSLWGGSVVNLGTEKHRAKYFDDIDSFRLPGCFAMTELRHGSNVAGLQVLQSLKPLQTWVILLPRSSTGLCRCNAAPTSVGGSFPPSLH